MCGAVKSKPTVLPVATTRCRETGLELVLPRESVTRIGAIRIIMRVLGSYWGLTYTLIGHRIFIGIPRGKLPLSLIIPPAWVW